MQPLHCIMSLVVSYILLITIVYAQFPPEQIHIMLGSTPDIITFNWVTMDYPISTKSVVRVGLTDLPNEMTTWNEGSTTLFTDSGSLLTNRTIHVANITGLLPSTTYYYQVGDPIYGWSYTFSFKTLHTPQDAPYKFILFGDLGIYNSLCLNAMIEECFNGNVDLVLFFGDMAYNMHNQNGSYGDQFLSMLEPLGARCPIMVSPGNHESAYNFSHFTERWRGMPNPGITNYPVTGGKQVHTYNGYAPNNWYYSYNVGQMHIVSISTEIYFSQKFLINASNEWLINDLKEANKNRTLAPWIIVLGHRNMYCSSKCGNFCTSDADVLKTQLEQIFFEQGVDFYFAGHEHNYERMYDIYQNKSNQLTTNMTSTTYIVSGAVGTCAYNDKCCPFYPQQPEWSAVRSLDYSYSRFYVYNQTHIHLQQILYDGKTVIDDIWFEQYKHGPFIQSEVEQVRTNKNTQTMGETYKFSSNAMDDISKNGDICNNFINVTDNQIHWNP